MFGFLCESFGFKVEIHVGRTEWFQTHITLEAALKCGWRQHPLHTCSTGHWAVSPADVMYRPPADESSLTVLKACPSCTALKPTQMP